MSYQNYLVKSATAAKRKEKRTARVIDNAELNPFAHVSVSGKRNKKKSLSLSKLKKLLWTEISLLVRSWSPICMGCGVNPTECAAHIVPSNEGAMTRYFLPNLYPCCLICNGLEKWNRATWVYRHRELFGDMFVDSLYEMSNVTFQIKKWWIIEQTERMRRLNALRTSGALRSRDVLPASDKPFPEVGTCLNNTYATGNET